MKADIIYLKEFPNYRLERKFKPEYTVYTPMVKCRKWLFFTEWKYFEFYSGLGGPPFYSRYQWAITCIRLHITQNQ